MKKKHNHWEIWVAIIILILFIIFLNWPEKQEKQEEFDHPLIKILEFEVSSATEYFKIMNVSPNCLDYALYYNNSLQKYEGMDIRFPRRIDMCNNGTYCENLHTYILVNSHFSNCILDQKDYTCIHRKIKDIKNNK